MTPSVTNARVRNDQETMFAWIETGIVSVWLPGKLSDQKQTRCSKTLGSNAVVEPGSPDTP